ncbi:hypothetical protein L581_3453 [Serratia fonticola AU-AP2C]|nr:hypothetical protein L581_3453 [Serratia fonticola AU-AP2C]
MVKKCTEFTHSLKREKQAGENNNSSMILHDFLATPSR